MTIVLDRVNSQYIQANKYDCIATKFHVDGGCTRLLIPHDVSEKSVIHDGGANMTGIIIDI